MKFLQQKDRFYGNDIEYADVFNPTADLYQDDTLLGTLSVQYVDKGFLTTPSVSNDSPELGWIENCNRAVIHIGNYEHTINEIEEYYEPQE